MTTPTMTTPTIENLTDRIMGTHLRAILAHWRECPRRGPRCVRCQELRTAHETSLDNKAVRIHSL